jgi:glycosyltransferase involved in cell wall biosynthesis
MADLFVFHSTFETLGLVLLQAMASGKAVVSVDSTAIPEVIDSGKNGLLVEPLKPEEFAEAVLSLLKNSEQREHFGVLSREKVVKKFNWDSISDRYEEIFFKCQKSQETS